MPIELVDPLRMTAGQIATWHDLQRADAHYQSPYFSPAFTRAVAQVRTDVTVAALKCDGENVGFLPFQRVGRTTGRPVGWKLNDFQGAVISRHVEVDATELLHGAKLTAWHFDHLIPGQDWCGPTKLPGQDSPYIDLDNRFERYLKEKTDSKSRRLNTVLRKSRKLGREVGPLHFEFDCREAEVLRRLLEWKEQQLQATRSSNVFRLPWARHLLDVLWKNDEPECRGTLSALWAGDELIAAHFGVRNATVLHWWLTSFRPEFGRYSPGSILLVELLRNAAELGLARVDLGKGEETYKKSFQTGAVTVSEGVVARSALRRTVLQTMYRARGAVRSSWLKKPVRQVKQLLCKLSSRGSNRETGLVNSCPTTGEAAASSIQRLSSSQIAALRK